MVIGAYLGIVSTRRGLFPKALRSLSFPRRLLGGDKHTNGREHGASGPRRDFPHRPQRKADHGISPSPCCKALFPCRSCLASLLISFPTTVIISHGQAKAPTRLQYTPISNMKLSVMAITTAHLVHAISATPVSQTETRSFAHHAEGNVNANALSGNSIDGKDTTVSRNMCCNNGCTICPIGWYCPDYECTNPLVRCLGTHRVPAEITSLEQASL